MPDCGQTGGAFGERVHPQAGGADMETRVD